MVERSTATSQHDALDAGAVEQPHRVHERRQGRAARNDGDLVSRREEIALSSSKMAAPAPRRGRYSSCGRRPSSPQRQGVGERVKVTRSLGNVLRYQTA